MRPARALAALLALAPAASFAGDGGSEDFSIKTPFGGFEVSHDATPEDVGLPVFTGARPEGDGDDAAVRLGLRLGGKGFRLAVLKFRSGEAAAKVEAFYRAELARYGEVRDCSAARGDKRKGDDEDGDLNIAGERFGCDGDDEPGVIRLQVGSKKDRRVVAITPLRSGGTKFVLLRLRVRTKGG